MQTQFHKSTFLLGLLALFSVMLMSCGGKKEEKEKESLMSRPKTETAPKKEIAKLSPGKKAFIQCAACHNLKKGEPHKVGPNLNGIFGRKAASLEDFNYSEALQNSEIVWNEDHIRNWLTKPSDYVPGTTMAFIGIKNEEQQNALIEYLKEETQ